MGKLQRILRAMIAGGAGLAAVAALTAKHARSDGKHGELSHTDDGLGLNGAREIYEWTHGNISYQVAGGENAPALVFVHSIRAGSSRFIWSRNFDALAADFRVYAIDLIGFGESEKPALPYTAALYIALLKDFLRRVVRASGKVPVHIVAHGLSAAFAVHLADEAPDLVSTLTLIAPRLADGANATRAGKDGAAFYGLLNSPVLGASFYNAMASERGIRDFAREHLFYDKNLVTPQLIAHYYAMSHKAGAQYAVSAYISGQLNADARHAFARLTQPVTLVWGKQDAQTPLAHAAALLRLNPRARLEVFNNARAWAHYEHHERFNALMRRIAHPGVAT
jgi:pimeloyl-ACP methyl ester carboxylesterase